MDKPVIVVVNNQWYGPIEESEAAKWVNEYNRERRLGVKLAYVKLLTDSKLPDISSTKKDIEKYERRFLYGGAL